LGRNSRISRRILTGIFQILNLANSFNQLTSPTKCYDSLE
jgi:hypothetical protein